MKKMVSMLLSLCLLIPALAFAADLSTITQYPAGMYKVGGDLPAGEYLAIAKENAIIPMVTVKSSSGVDAEINALSTFTTFAIIGAADGKYVEVTDSFLIPLSDSKAYVDTFTAESIGDGSYKVGFHIPAGEYKYALQEDVIIPMISVYADAYQENILNLVMPQGNGYITLDDGQYVTVSDAILTK